MTGLSSGGESLLFLLVSVREEMRDLIGAMLTGRMGDHRLYWVSQPELALVRTQDLIPHVVLVDDELGGVTPAALISQLATHVPNIAVLALVGADAIASARQAVLAGARGFVTKPLVADDLLVALRQVVAKPFIAAGASEPEAAGRVTVFCAPKGGTGRTTLAANAAVSLHQLSGESVVLIDADYAAPALDVALNLNTGQSILDLLPKLSNLDSELVTQVLTPHASGIQVLLAPPPAELSTTISLPHIQRILAWLKRMFPWVVVDIGLPLDETAYGFLDGADRVVMTVLPELVGLRNARLMLDQFRERGYPNDKTWIALNRSTLRGGLAVGTISDHLNVKIKYEVPDDQNLVTHSVNRGIPLMMSHSRSAVGRSIRGLARQLMDERSPAQPAGLGESQQNGKAFGLLGNLRSRA